MVQKNCLPLREQPLCSMNRKQTCMSLFMSDWLELFAVLHSAVVQACVETSTHIAARVLSLWSLPFPFHPPILILYLVVPFSVISFIADLQTKVAVNIFLEETIVGYVHFTAFHGNPLISSIDHVSSRFSIAMNRLCLKTALPVWSALWQDAD